MLLVSRSRLKNGVFSNRLESEEVHLCSAILHEDCGHDHFIMLLILSLTVENGRLISGT